MVEKEEKEKEEGAWRRNEVVGTNEYVALAEYVDDTRLRRDTRTQPHEGRVVACGTHAASFFHPWFHLHHRWKGKIVEGRKESFFRSTSLLKTSLV